MMKPGGRCLIINADDFGYSHERDRGIMECFQTSAISSASLLVNGVNVVQAVELAKQENLPLGKICFCVEVCATFKNILPMPPSQH